MKVRATNPAPEENPGCATCGFGVPKPPPGGGTSASRRQWAMSQVGGRLVFNPDVPPATEPEGHGMARQFRPKKAPTGVHPGRFKGRTLGEVNPAVGVPAARNRWRSRNCDAGVGLALAATQPPGGPILQANPGHVRIQRVGNPPPPLGRGGQLDYANQYLVFAPGYQPYGGYAGVGYAPGGTSIPTAYPVAPPGVYMQGQGCVFNSDCAPGEYCHGGMCFPTPGVQSVGSTQVVSVAGKPVGNPHDPWVVTFPTKRAARARRARDGLGQPLLPPFYRARTPALRAANPGAPMTHMTQSLAPPGFAVR